MAPCGKAGMSAKGGPLCPIESQEESGCSPCKGKVTDLTLQYNGQLEAQVTVTQKKGNVVVFDELVQPGGQFSFSGTHKGTLGTEIKIRIDGESLSGSNFGGTHERVDRCPGGRSANTRHADRVQRVGGGCAKTAWLWLHHPTAGLHPPGIAATGRGCQNRVDSQRASQRQSNGA